MDVAAGTQALRGPGRSGMTSMNSDRLSSIARRREGRVFGPGWLVPASNVYTIPSFSISAACPYIDCTGIVAGSIAAPIAETMGYMY